jgi:threonine synthase
MIVVQAEHCAPIAKAFAEGERHAPLWEGARTIAAGMRVPVAIGDYLILDAVRESGGTALTVTDDELREGMRLVSTLEGMVVSPESGAAFIAARKLRESGDLDEGDEVVVFSTGSGLMHTDLIDTSDAPVVDPAAIDAFWDEWPGTPRTSGAG